MRLFPRSQIEEPHPELLRATWTRCRSIVLKVVCHGRRWTTSAVMPYEGKKKSRCRHHSGHPVGQAMSRTTHCRPGAKARHPFWITRSQSGRNVRANVEIIPSTWVGDTDCVASLSPM